MPQVDRTGEVSSSGVGANGAQLRENRSRSSKLQQQQSRKKGGKAQQPPQQTRKQTETSSEQESTPSIASEAIKRAKTMQELSEVRSLCSPWLRWYTAEEHYAYASKPGGRRTGSPLKLVLAAIIHRCAGD